MHSDGPNMVLRPQSAEDVRAAVAPLTRVDFEPERDIQALAAFGDALEKATDLHTIPGFVFLRLWLRQASLERVIEQDFGTDQTQADSIVMPLGVVSCWPAANVEIQPLLAASTILLSGNACVLRVPSDLVKITELFLKTLRESDAWPVFENRLVAMAIDRSNTELLGAMAATSDGASIWGGAEAINAVRALPFRPGARFVVFGPRYSVGVVSADMLGRPDTHQLICERLARDVWPFEQNACSSPHVLYVEAPEQEPGGALGAAATGFLDTLKDAFEREDRYHPREVLEPVMATSVSLVRAEWLMRDQNHVAVQSSAPSWTILAGSSPVSMPTSGYRVLVTLFVNNLDDVVGTLDPDVQTVGMACGDEGRERKLARSLACRGVDRIVPFGQMHIFDTPWDGHAVCASLTRIVRHNLSTTAFGSQS